MPCTLLSHPQWLVHKYKALAKAALVNLPWRPKTGKIHGTGGTQSARYCYSVWLRHLVIAHQNGLKGVPQVVAELGPGDSLGIGLAALLCGTQYYYALDVVHHADQARNLAVFDGLIELFQKRSPIPDRTEFPKVKPFLDSYEFPSHILSEEHLKSALDERRLGMIRGVLSGNGQDDEISIRYFVPWYNKDTVLPGTVDLIYSQAVLEYVDDLPEVYGALFRWLKPGGWMSHQIDFKSHGITEPWNGHWAFSEAQWRVLKGNRPYFLNREPCSTHIDQHTKSGFKIACVQKLMNASESDRPLEIPKHFLTGRFRTMPDEELAVSGALIQAYRPGG